MEFTYSTQNLEEKKTLLCITYAPKSLRKHVCIIPLTLHEGLCSSKLQETAAPIKEWRSKAQENPFALGEAPSPHPGLLPHHLPLCPACPVSSSSSWRVAVVGQPQPEQRGAMQTPSCQRSAAHSSPGEQRTSKRAGLQHCALNLRQVLVEPLRVTHFCSPPSTLPPGCSCARTQQTGMVLHAAFSAGASLSFVPSSEERGCARSDTPGTERG